MRDKPNGNLYETSPAAARRFIRSWVGLSFVLLTLWPSSAAAWVFSEHTEITERALQKLFPVSQTDHKLSAALLELELKAEWCPHTSKTCPDNALRLAVIPALAGDHSCSPAELAQTLTNARGSSAWVSDVLLAAAETRRRLHKAGTKAKLRESIRRDMHVQMQNVDSRYLERAMIDYSHFQLLRESSVADLEQYLRFALASAREANATATYVNYHLAALRTACLAEKVADKHKPMQLDLKQRALLYELFALHFLEDSFAAGHIVGHWGDTPTRMGTHDYYARRGIAASRWKSPRVLTSVHGDAFISDGELDAAATAVARSLRQVLQPKDCKEIYDDSDAALAVDTALAVGDVTGAAFVKKADAAFGLAEYDSCKEPLVPPGLTELASDRRLQSVLELQPTPALRHPHLPRFRIENGVFVGGAASMGLGLTANSLATPLLQVKAGGRIGYGAAGIVDDPMSSQAFFDFAAIANYGIGIDGESTRLGYDVRLRAPGYLTLIDGGIGLILALWLKTDCPFCVGWAAAAAGGGMGRVWKSHALIGRVSWQFAALRDVTLRWFPASGALRNRIELMLPALALRSVLPISGEGVAQSTDLYVDLGVLLTRDSGEPIHVGGFLSVTTATRVFP